MTRRSFHGPFHKAALLLSGLTVFPAAAAAEPPDFARLSLRGAVEDTISVSPLLRAAQAQVRAADAAVQKSYAGFFPRLSASVGDDRIFGSKVLQNDRSGSDGRAGLSLQWTLFDGFQSLNASRSASLLRDSARYDADSVRDELQLDIVAAYLSFVEAEKTTELIRTNIASATRLLAAVQARQQDGFSSAMDVERINADVAMLSEELVSAKTAAERARLKVSSLVGRPVRLLPDLPDLRRHLKGGPQQMISSATMKNPRLRAARASAEAADYSVRAARGKYLPQLNLTGAYTYDFGETARKNSREEDWKIGVQLSVPLVDVSTMADVARSEELANVSHFQSIDRQRELRLEIESLWAQLEGEKKRLGFLDQQVKAQDGVLRSSQEQFEQGFLTLDEVLIQRRNVISARLSRNRVEFQQYLTASRLLVTSGLFSPDMLDI